MALVSVGPNRDRRKGTVILGIGIGGLFGSVTVAATTDPYIGIAAIIAAIASGFATVIGAMNRSIVKKTERHAVNLNDTAERVEQKIDSHTEVATTAAEANRALRDWLVADAAQRRAGN